MPMAATDKVGFIVAGVQKAGTSALDLYLREHPELCLPKEKASGLSVPLRQVTHKDEWWD